MSFYNDLKVQVDNYDALRQSIIKKSSDITKKSKKSIFEIHRGDFVAAEKLLVEVLSLITEIQEMGKEDIKLLFEGSYRASLEEFVEAELFYNYVVKSKVHLENYEFLGFKEKIGGLCDFTGEIVRRARLYVIEGKFDELESDYHTIHDIMEQLLIMNLSSYLRTKFDQLKRNVYNMEQIRYDHALQQK